MRVEILFDIEDDDTALIQFILDKEAAGAKFISIEEQEFLSINVTTQIKTFKSVLILTFEEN